MCNACDDENENADIDFLAEIPEEEREEFFNYAQEQFRNVINLAEGHDILHELIIDWAKERQAAFTFAAVLDSRARAVTELTLNPDEDELGF